MARYAAELQDTLGTGTTMGAVRVDGTTARRFKLYDVMFGSEATPADAAILWTITRADGTGAGTATGVTAAKLDPADVAAIADPVENFTAEPTTYEGVALVSVALNQRASFRWVASPGGELICPATVNALLGIRTPVISTGTPVATASVQFEE